MALPTFTDVASLPEFKQLPFQEKEATVKRYWNEYAAENPADQDYANTQLERADSFYKLNDSYSRANAIDKRLLKPQLEDLEFSLKADEGLKRGILDEATYNQALENHKLKLQGLQLKIEEAQDFQNTSKNREAYRNALQKTLLDNKLFNSASSAMGAAKDPSIKRNRDGSLDLPFLVQEPDNSIVKGIAGAVTPLAQRTGARLEDAGIGVDKEKIRNVFYKFQKDNNLNDVELKGAWDDLTKINKKMESSEKGRILSDGSILPNMQNTDWLDTEKAEKLIDSFEATELSKELTKSRLPEIQRQIAQSKLKAYGAASAISPLDSPDDWAVKNNRKADFGSPEFVKDYENAVAKKAGWTQGLIADLQQGNMKVASTLAGLGGLAGSETAGNVGAEMSEASQLVGQGSFDTGIAGSIIEEIPSLAVQIAVTRGVPVGAAIPTSIATAGGQSAGATYSELISQGVSEKEARDKSLKAGVNTMLITGAFQGLGAGGLESVAAGKAVSNIAMRDLFKAATKKELAANYAKYAGGLFKSAAGEGLEEGLNTATEMFINADPDTNLADAWANSVEALKVGAAIGGAAAAVSSIAQTPTYKKTTEEVREEADAVIEDTVIEDESTPDLETERSSLVAQIENLPPESDERIALEERLAEVDEELGLSYEQTTAEIQELPSNETSQTPTEVETGEVELPAETTTNPKLPLETVTEPQQDVVNEQDVQGSTTEQAQEETPLQVREVSVGETGTLDSESNVDAPQDAESEGEAEVEVEPLTQEAQELLENGGTPSSISKNLERIAQENGIEITDSMRPADVVEELRQKQQSLTPAEDQPSSTQQDVSVETPVSPIAETTQNTENPPEQSETPTDTLPEGQTSPEGKGEVAAEPPSTPPPHRNETPDAEPQPEPDQVGIRKSMTTALRRKVGLLEDPTIRIEGETKAAIIAADEEIKSNPDVGENVVVSLEGNYRPATLRETAILSFELTKAVNELESAEKANANPSTDAAIRRKDLAKEEAARLRIDQITAIILSQGRAKSLALNAQKIVRRKNYSYEGMVARAISAKNKGSDKKETLTEEERKDIRARSKKIEMSDKELADAITEAYQEGRLDAEREAAIEAKKNVRGKKKTKAEKVADLERQRKDAKKRLDDRRRRRMSGEEGVAFSGVPITEEDVSDIKIIATSYIQQGFVTLSDFTAKLVEEFGESVRKFASDIFEESKALLEASGVVKTPAQLVAEMDATKPIDRRSVNLMVRQYYTDDITLTHTQVVDKLVKDLKAKWPDVTRNQASDAWTGYGIESTTPQTRNEMNRAVANGRRAAKLTREIEGLKDGSYKGKRKNPAKVDEEIAELTKERNRLLRAAKLPVPKDPLKSAKNRLLKEAESLEQAVAKNELIPKKDRTSRTDAELEALKKRRDAVKALYEEAFPDQNVKINAKERRILDFQEAVRKNEMLPSKERSEKTNTELDEQLKKAKKEYEDFFKESGPKLTAKERTFLDLQNAINRNQLLPDTAKNKKEKTELDNQIKDLRKKYNELFKLQGTQLTPNQEIDRVVKVFDKQIERLEKEQVAESKRPDFDWWSPEIADKRKRLDDLRNTRNEIKWQEKNKEQARKTIAVLNDILTTGNLPETSKKKSKFTPDEKLKALWDERNRKQKEVAALRREKGQEDRQLKAAEKSLKEYERRIREKDFIRKPQAADTSQRVREIRAMRDEARRTLNEMDTVGRENRVVAAIERNTRMYQDKIKRGDFKKEKKDPLKTKRVEDVQYENAKIKNEWNKRVTELEIANYTKWQKFMRGFEATSSFAKLIKLSFDMGNFFRNVGPRTLKLAVTPWRWKELAKMYSSGVSAMLNAKNEYAIYKVYSETPEMMEFGGHEKLGLKLINPIDSSSVNQEAGLSLNFVDKLAVASAKRTLGTNYLAKLSLAIERANRTFSNVARAEMYIQYRQLQNGPPMTLKQAQDLAQSINITTGYGGLSQETTAGKDFEKAVTFFNSTIALSARWTAAKIQYGLGVPIWVTPGYKNKARMILDVYVLNFAGKVLVGGAIKAAFMALKGDEFPEDWEEWEREFITKWNPWDSQNGGKLSLDGKTTISLDSGNDSFMSLIAKSLPYYQQGTWQWKRRKDGTKARREMIDGEWEDISPNDLSRKWSNYFLNRINPPVAQAFRTFVREQNYNREPLTLSTTEGRWNLAEEWLSPIIVTDTKNIYDNHGIEGVLVWASIFNGANVRFVEDKKKSTPKPTPISFGYD